MLNGNSEFVFEIFLEISQIFVKYVSNVIFPGLDKHLQKTPKTPTPKPLESFHLVLVCEIKSIYLMEKLLSKSTQDISIIPKNS